MNGAVEAAELELLSNEGLVLVLWATGRQAEARRAAGEAEEAARLESWSVVAEAELARRGVAPGTPDTVLAA